MCPKAGTILLAKVIYKKDDKYSNLYRVFDTNDDA
jgi:hypothetical protein